MGKSRKSDKVMGLNDLNLIFLRTMRIIYIIHTVLYFPVMYVFNPIWMLVILLRCFFIPYISTIILSILYIWAIKKQQLAPPDAIIFPVMLVINIISFVCMEAGFDAAMGI